MPNPNESRTPAPTPSSSPEGAAALAATVAEEVRQEQVRLLYEQLPVGAGSVVLAAVVTAALFWGEADPAVAGAWLGLLAVLALASLVPWLSRRGAAVPVEDPRRHIALFVIGAALTGSVFGFAPVVFAGGGGFDQLAMLLTIVAMLGVAGVPAFGADFRVYAAFLLPLTLPVTARMFFAAHPAAPSMGALRIAFIALLVVTALQLRGKLQQVLRLQVQDTARRRELTAYAARLESEVQQRRATEKELHAHVATLEQTAQALTREVAERAKNEEVLARQALTILESEVRLRAIFNNAFDGIITFDADGRILAANPAAEHLFGLKAEELKRRRIRDLLPDLRPEEAGPSMVSELSGLRADGVRFPASLSVERTASGTETLFVCLVRDNTAEHRSRQALVEARDAAERANRAKSEFLSSMSHELRTPMNSILGFAQLLQTDPDNPLTDTQKESVDQIARAGWHLLQLINDVLDLAKVEAGKIEAILEDVDLDTVMAECLSLVMPLAEKHGIELVDQATSTAFHVRADHTRLKQVVLNLVSNGIKYNRRNGSVAIEARRVDDWCEIAIVDTGVGLTPEQIDRIFEPFSRVAAHRDEIEGTGIGLTITRKLVALMGGAIGVESQPGQGSRFWVRIPLFQGAPGRVTASPGVQAAATGRPVGGGHQQTVLYVEDNPANLALVEYVLRQRRPHLRLLSAHTGELGISLAETQRPDLVILDISLPGMDGYQVLDVLRNTTATRDTPIFALSANAMQRDIEKGLAAGFDDYLTKPIDVTRLLGTIDTLLERRAAA
jgi:PAS domain S-box-containing protein